MKVINHCYNRDCLLSNNCFAINYNLLLLPPVMVEVIMGPMTSSVTMAYCYLTGEYCEQTHHQVFTSGEKLILIFLNLG